MTTKKLNWWETSKFIKICSDKYTQGSVSGYQKGYSLGTKNGYIMAMENTVRHQDYLDKQGIREWCRSEVMRMKEAKGE